MDRSRQRKSRDDPSFTVNLLDPPPQVAISHFGDPGRLPWDGNQQVRLRTGEAGADDDRNPARAGGHRDR